MKPEHEVAVERGLLGCRKDPFGHIFTVLAAVQSLVDGAEIPACVVRRCREAKGVNGPLGRPSSALAFVDDVSHGGNLKEY
jgi:hypothetical protein